MSRTKGILHTGGDGTIIYDKDGWGVANSTVFHGRLDGPTSAKENARRLVACWNAADGIDTDELESEGSAVMGWNRTARKLIEVAKKCDELIAEVAEESAVREKLATLLAETAVALKGQEAALFRHSWHDLADVAGKVVAQRGALLAALEEAKGIAGL